MNERILLRVPDGVRRIAMVTVISQQTDMAMAIREWSRDIRAVMGEYNG
ncbi:MAG: hypothetical protein U9P36_11055 [Thermodesulfobacteriota bacterium]|nr:hypothetical protein [Thermodesulfobacteriota bacterium]